MKRHDTKSKQATRSKGVDAQAPAALQPPQPHAETVTGGEGATAAGDRVPPRRNRKLRPAVPANEADQGKPKPTDVKPMVSLSSFVENPNNPSTATEADIERLAGKLKRVPLGLTAMRIAYVTDMVEGKKTVLSGNKRLRVLKRAYGEDGEIPADWVQDVTAMSEAERHEFIITANTSDGEWNIDQLMSDYDRAELDALMKPGELDELLATVGTAAPAEESHIDDTGKYTDKIGAPQYEITGDCPAITEMTDEAKYRTLVDEINAAEDVSDEVRVFLRMAATRHIVFDYAKIAEFYAHASAPVQRLMERSALVIIDFDNAIQNGYVKLNATMKNLREADTAAEDDAEDEP